MQITAPTSKMPARTENIVVVSRLTGANASASSTSAIRHQFITGMGA